MADIYTIANAQNGKVYVGSTACAVRRFAGHKSLLRRNLHPNSHLQKAWNKHGEAVFVFHVIESVPLISQLACEQKWIDLLKSYDRDIGYNLSKSASRHHFGIKHTAETRARISRNRAGKGRVSRPIRAETKTKLSRALKGRHFHSSLAKAKIGEASRNAIRTEDWCRRISESQAGKARWTPEEKERIRQQRLGASQSLETKQKRSKTLKALFASQSYKLKRSEWCKRAWITRRNSLKTTSSS